MNDMTGVMARALEGAHPVRGWHGDWELKARIVEQMRAHREADAITQGSYGSVDDAGRFRGCFWGCTLTPVASPVLLSMWTGEEAWRFGRRSFGIPESLGAALDAMFERLHSANCAAFAIDSVEAVPVGARLDLVVDCWLWDMLSDMTYGVFAQLKHVDQELAHAILLVSGLLLNRIEGVTSGNDPEEWRLAVARCFAAFEKAYDASCAANDRYADSTNLADRRAVIEAQTAAEAANLALTIAQLTPLDSEAIEHGWISAVINAHTAFMDSVGELRPYDGAWTDVQIWQAGRLLEHIKSAPVD